MQVSKENLIVLATAHRFLAVILAPTLALASERTQPASLTWSAPVEVASGEARVGPWRMNASEFHYVDDPTVAISKDGVIGVAWVDQTRQNVFFQSYKPDGTRRFARAIDVSRTPKIFSWLPRIVMAGSDPGAVYVLWQEIVFSGGSHGGEIFFARSLDGGRTFDRPLNLSNSKAGDGKGRLTRRYWHNGSLDLAIGNDGVLYAAWTEYEGALWFSRSLDGGATFSHPLRVNHWQGALPARGPSLAIDADGTVYLAWTVGETASADVRVAKSNTAGRSFARPTIVFKSTGHADAPKIAVDADRVLHLVYGESPGGPLRHYHIRYTRSQDGAQTFDEPRSISSTPDNAGGNFPALAVDQDDLYVLWERFAAGAGRSLGLGFTVSSDAGRTFATPSVIPGSAVRSLGHNGSRQGLLMSKLAVGEAGAIAVVNSRFKRDEASRIRLLRGQRAGR